MSQTDTPLTQPDFLVESFHNAAKQLPLSVALGHHYHMHELLAELNGRGCKTLYDLTSLTAEDFPSTSDAVKFIKSELAAWSLALKPSEEDKLVQPQFDKRKQPYHRKMRV